MRLARLAQVLTVVAGVGVLTLVGLFGLAAASQSDHERAMRVLMALGADALSVAGDVLLVAGLGPQDVASFAVDALGVELRASGAPAARVAEALAAIDHMVAVAEHTWADAAIPAARPRPWACRPRPPPR